MKGRRERETKRSSLRRFVATRDRNQDSGKRLKVANLKIYAHESVCIECIDLGVVVSRSIPISRTRSKKNWHE